MNDASLTFSGAVAELQWPAAARAAAAMAPIKLADIEADPALENALIQAAASGPHWLLEELRERVFADVISTRRAPRTCIWREEVLRGIAAANVGWAAGRRVMRAAAASAAHVARAFHVPVVCATQAEMVARAFADVVDDAKSAEERLGGTILSNADMLVQPDAADAVMQRFFGALRGPGGWIRIALEACAEAPHYSHRMKPHLALVFRECSWPTLRQQWWVLAAHRDALPDAGGETTPVARRWLAIAHGEGPAPSS